MPKMFNRFDIIMTSLKVTGHQNVNIAIERASKSEQTLLKHYNNKIDIFQALESFTNF